MAWIKIKLVDSEGNTLSGEKVRIEMADGRVHDGILDVNGEVRLEDAGTSPCMVSFPDLDESEWQRV